jgi:hypothetical protein
MGFPLPNLVQTRFLPHLDLMDLLPLLIMSSLVKVNGELGEDFRLARSVKQGCPLAPYLFILTTDVLGHMLDDPKHEIKGMDLPKGVCVRNQTFADDIALYLKGSPSNLSKVRAIIELFCLPSGIKINWGKSAAIWVNKEKKGWVWGQEIGLRWIPEGQGV